MMTVHVLHAGDGYTYLTRQVASGDEHRPAGESLADYYAHEGNPPGRWIGTGMAAVGVTGQVREEQMRALFGEGLHPEADRLIGEGARNGQSVEAAIAAARLGRRFPKFAQVEGQAEWRSAIAGAYESFTQEHGRSPEVGPERDLIRWNVAGELLAGTGNGEVSDADRAAFIAQVGRQQRHPVAGYDLVFTPAKSVSTLWALADVDTSREVAAAHEAAWKGAFAWVEQEAGVTRTGAGGVAQIDTNGLMAAAFDHADSRTGDPNLHTHVAVSNKVQGTDGRWRALDGRVLHALGVAASERYNTLIEQELRDRLAVTFVDETRGRARQPVREIAGIDKDVREVFSSRRAAIEDVYAQLLADYRSKHGHEPSTKAQLSLAQQATLETREGKKQGVPRTVQRGQWRATAARVLGGEEAVDVMIAGAITRSQPTPEAGEAQAAPIVVDEEGLAHRVITEVASKRATWGPWHLMAEALRQARAHPTGEPVTAVAERIAGRAQALSIPLDPPELNPTPAPLQRADGESIYTVHGARRFTSQEVLDAEENVVQAALRSGGLRASKDDLTAAFTTVEHQSGRPLDTGQQAMAAAFATSGREVVAGIGPAGAGKTTAMRAFARAVENAGGRVVGLAPSAAAAAVLGDELGVRAETLHKLLYEHTRARSSRGLGIDAHTVVLVDEAGMAGTPELARVVDLAREHGASVRLLGDPGQLAAIGAGGLLRLVDERVGAIHLHQLHRFTNPQEAAASLHLRDGDTRGVDFYIHHDRVRGGTRQDMLDEVFTAWQADHAAGRGAVMIAPTNEDATALSAQAKRERVAAGEVEAGGVLLTDGTQAGRGDRIVTRLNDRQLATAGGKDFVKNGDTWMVLDHDPTGRLRARHTEHGGTITLPAGYVSTEVHLAYAATIHRVQGRTTDRAHALVDAHSTNRPSLYTAVTRGRESNRIYVITEENAEVDGHVPGNLSVSASQGLYRILAREGSALAATSTQERAWNQAHSLQRLVPEFHDARARLMEKRTTLLAARVSTALGSDTADQITAAHTWPRVAARLAAHEDAGSDLDAMLRNVRGSVAADIHKHDLTPAYALYRSLPTSPNPMGKWAHLPTTPTGNPQIRGWAERHQELIGQRIDHLLDQAVVGQLPWVTANSPPPRENDDAFAAWAAGARDVLAYRDQYDITGSAPLGSEPTTDAQRIDYDRATRGLQTMRTATHSPAPDGSEPVPARQRLKQLAQQQRAQAPGPSTQQTRLAQEALNRYQQQPQHESGPKPTPPPAPRRRPPERQNKPRGPSL